MKLLSVAMEMLHCVSFALLLGYETLQTAVNNINVLESSCKVYIISVPC